MVEVALAEKAAITAWGFIKPFAVFIACAAVGFAAAEMFEHRGPTKAPFAWVMGQSLRYQRDQVAASIPAKVAAAKQAGADAQAKADAPQFDKWKAALQQCQSAGQAATAKESAALASAAAFATTQTSVAYRLGRATCGAPDAPTSPVPPGAAGPGGLRDQAPGSDFRSIFAAGAYTPGGAHPVSGGGHDAPADGAAPPGRR